MTHDLRSLWRPARVIENRRLSEGSAWIALEAVDDLPAAFDPGHVLGLGLMIDDQKLMRHAYTVSRGTPSQRRFEHLYRIISGGRMSPLLAGLSAGHEVFFHGPFHTPIHQEVQPEAEQIILMSTGAGVGPLYGYAEKVLSEGESRPMTLYAGFREESHACLADELQSLTHRYPNFGWHFTLSRPSRNWSGLVGRVTESVPERVGMEGLSRAHFHLVGNGAMVHLVKNALYRAGVAPGRVSTETYFNHSIPLNESEVEQVAARFSGRVMSVGVE
ncbi:MAG TPA: FAD-dependent oxidoreductase [Terriglobia bacterium]|nr:FAD-dependent oxidoreductase [Terriglobia bacterium]